MNRRWLGPVALMLAAGAIVAYRHSGKAGSSVVASDRWMQRPPAVLLVADPSEAGSSCGCGEIIRLVRGAAARGVATRELPPDGDRPVRSRYKVVVSPTVLLLDPDGEVTARFEGEEPETVSALATQLDRIR